MESALVANTLAVCLLVGLGLYDLHLLRNYREVQFKRKVKA